VVRALILLCKLSERRVLALFIVAIFVWRVFSWVCIEAWPSATLPIMLVVCYMLADMDSSRVFSDEVLVALEDITML